MNLTLAQEGWGWFFGRAWALERAPLNSQWPLLKNGGADFHHCWFVNSM